MLFIHTLINMLSSQQQAAVSQDGRYMYGKLPAQILFGVVFSPFLQQQLQLNSKQQLLTFT